MKSKTYVNFSYLFMPILPLISIIIFTKSRDLYFDTKTTIPTNQIVKITLLMTAISIGITFPRLITYVSKRKILINLKIHQYLPNLAFILFVFLPNILSEFHLELPAKSIYKFLRVSYLYPPFADLRTIIYGIKCDAVSQVGNLITCDLRNASPVACNYPSVLLKLRSISFLFENIPWVVILISIFLAISIQFLSFNQTLNQNLLMTSIILSPPFLLCFGRLNFDLFIVWIIWIGILFLESKKVIIKYLAFVLFLIAGLLKFYGFAAFISIFKNFNLKKFFIGIAIFMIGFNLIQVDLSHLENAVGKDIYGSIGFPVVAALLNGLPRANLNLFSYGSIFIVFYIGLYVRLIILKENIRIKTDGNILIQLVFGSTFLFTWFSSSNYYYRLLLLTPILLFMIKYRTSFFEKMVISSTYFSFFLSPKVFGPLQNFFLLPMICYLIAQLLVISRYETTKVIKKIFDPA